MTFLQRARRVFQIELEAIATLRKRLDSTFDDAVRLILDTLAARGKVVVVGIGKSGHIGQKLAATLSSTGSPAVVLNPVDALHGDLGLIHDGDLVIALSYSGESEELVQLLPALKRFSVQIIALTGSPKSTLARHSDVVLNTRIPREACPFNLAPTASTTASLVLGDALAITVMEARGFRLRDFAQRHPSGAIGRTMLLTAADLMRRDERNAIATANTLVKEALLIMTRARSGSVSIVSPRGRLVGVFTDGDLRRRMPVDPRVLERRLGEVMTRRPVWIRDTALATEVLKAFDQRAIDDLIVVNKRREPVGLIDSQDLPKLKLM